MNDHAKIIVEMKNLLLSALDDFAAKLESSSDPAAPAVEATPQEVETDPVVRMVRQIQSDWSSIPSQITPLNSKDVVGRVGDLLAYIERHGERAVALAVSPRTFMEILPDIHKYCQFDSSVSSWAEGFFGYFWGSFLLMSSKVPDGQCYVCSDLQKDGSRIMYRGQIVSG